MYKYKYINVNIFAHNFLIVSKLNTCALDLVNNV